MGVYTNWPLTKVPPSFSTTRPSAAINSDASAAPPAPACANNAPNDERPKAARVVLRVNSQTEDKNLIVGQSAP